ncbi:MAG: hypothetical protein R3362_05840, partial [Rhodothermales bacterium]|nr:hypothetical protein [Rhodothermales bacterium]
SWAAAVPVEATARYPARLRRATAVEPTPPEAPVTATSPSSGPTLASLIAQTDRHGSIAAYGLAQSHELHTTVFPFILRGVNLLGIDSNTCPPERRQRAWDRLDTALSSDDLAAMSDEIGLDEVIPYSEKITQGQTQGRIVVDVNR